MRKRVSIMLIILLALIFSTSSYAFAAGPLAEIYSYPGQVSTDVYKIGDLVGGLGYYSRPYNNVSAYYVRRTMNTDGIFFIASHGGPGKVYAYDSNGNRTSISGNSVSSDNSNYSLQALFGTNSSALKSIRLAYFSACEAARTDSVYGNIQSKTTSLGALCTIAFYNNIGDAEAKYFEQLFFIYTDKGYDVMTAANIALQDIRSMYQTDAGLGSIVISFRSGASSTVYLKPAAYGY